jgi:hypothetical protein
MGNTESFGNINSTPLIVIYETDTNNENLQKLKYMLTKNGYEYIILGQGDKWKGFGTKILACLKFYKTLNPERIVVQLDARDVLVNQPFDYFMKLISGYKDILDKKLIISTEPDVLILPAFAFPPGSFIDRNLNRIRSTYDETLQLHHQYKWNNEFDRINKNKFNKVNAGMIFGKVKNFINVYEIIKITEKEDDQILLSELYFIKPELIHLDMNNVFFTNVCFYQNCVIEGDIYKNKETNTEPVFIQTPGKNWLCYERLYEKFN